MDIEHTSTQVIEMSSEQCFITHTEPQRKAHHISSVEPSWLVLFKQTVAVYCENITKHIQTLCGHHEPPSVSATDGVHFMGSFKRSFNENSNTTVELLSGACLTKAPSPKMDHPQGQIMQVT
jgi:hypothetical protein